MGFITRQVENQVQFFVFLRYIVGLRNIKNVPVPAVKIESSMTRQPPSENQTDCP